MGITLASLENLRDFGLLKRGIRVLDIGSSNLYSADATGLKNFLAHYAAPRDDSFIQKMEDGSAYGPQGGTNKAFVGELLNRSGISYLSLDIANGYKTRIFDLNHEVLPETLHNAFDTVFNFGTTEHVLNQLNSFQLIHNATKHFGYIVHELPTAGYIDHGYFLYTPRFLFDMAGHNEYEVIDFSYCGPEEGRDIFDIVNDYKNYFPSLAKCVETRKPILLQNIASHVIFRKVKDTPFRLPVDTSTSVTVD